MGACLRRLRAKLWRKGKFRRSDKKAKAPGRLACADARRLLAAAPAPLTPGWQRPLREGGQAAQPPQAHEQPLVDPSRWPRLPPWIALHAERGRELRCFEGHLLRPKVVTRRKNDGCQKCPECADGDAECPFPVGTAILRCRQCGWDICGRCAAGTRLPTFQEDPLFRAPSVPCLLGAPGAAPSFGCDDTRGTLIVCPGGNYEFLCPHEGLPVAALFGQHGIRTCVLRYRLLPRHSHEDAVDDLLDAVRLIRSTCRGPVAAMGFSAGGHLVASLCARERLSQERLLDAQVLVYPGLDGSDWLKKESCGFFDEEQCLPKAPALLARQEALTGGAGFSAPTSMIVASTSDDICPPEAHCDPYVQALKKAGTPHLYLRKDYGVHGFALGGGWTGECIDWLQQQGFGHVPVSQ